MDEDLTRATHSMMFAVGNLQDALRNATAVEALLLLDMIESATRLQQRIEAMTAAVVAA
jgi:hypothetical protein